jgi:vesicle coat complex subunit
VIYNLLTSTSGAVRYEAAKTLLTLSSAPSAVTAVATCYTDLILKESDNNIKLIVLDRLIDLQRNPSHERVLQVCWINLTLLNCLSVCCLLSLNQPVDSCVGAGHGDGLSAHSCCTVT